MSNFDGVLNPAAGWPDIPQASTSMVVLGGAGGPLNEQATQLTARTKKLKEDIENIPPVGFGGQYKNLVVTVSGVGYQGTITADRLVVENDNFECKLLRNISLSFDGATVGINGLDVGVIANNTWYYIHVIHNPASNITASLLSLSATSPTLPAGYTKWCAIGSAYSLSGSFRGSTKTNRYVLWGVGNTANVVNVVNMSYAASVTSFSLSSAKPPSAKKTSLRLTLPTGSTGWAEINIDAFRNVPIIYINQTEQAFCADIQELVANTLYYITSGPSAKVNINVYGYEDSL